MNKKEFVVILVITFGVIMAWVVGDILHTRAKVQVSPQLQDVSQALDPTFDTATFQIISQIVSYQKTISSNPVQELNLPNLPTPVSTPTPTPSLSPSPSASISASPTSSQSAYPSP